MKDLTPLEWSNQRVLTTRQLADFYGVRPNRIKDNFSRARDQFKEGVHYFKLTGEALRQFKREAEKNDPALISPSASCIYLWTVRGAARHAKMINTQQAWNVFNELEKSYFECQKAALPAPTEENVLRKEVSRLKKQIITAESLELAVVYLLLMSDGSVKIGYTSNLTERIKQLQAQTGLEVLNYKSTPFMSVSRARRLEEQLKDKYAAFKITGEYFDIRFIDACADI